MGGYGSPCIENTVQNQVVCIACTRHSRSLSALLDADQPDTFLRKDFQGPPLDYPLLPHFSGHGF